MKMDIINIDWDDLMLRSNEFSPSIRGLIIKLVNPQIQKAIYELRGRWDIPQYAGLDVLSFMDNLEYWAAPEKLVNNVNITLAKDIENNIIRPFNLPLEHLKYVAIYVTLGIFVEETSNPHVLRREKVKSALENMREAEKMKTELNKEFRKQNFLSDHEADCGGTHVHFDSDRGKIIITHDVMSPFAEIDEMKIFIEECKKNAAEFYKETGERKQTGTKQPYTFVVELIIHKILDEIPHASNAKILAEAQFAFKDLYPDIPLSEVKELPPLSDAPGFVKCVQRVKNARIK